MMPTMPAYVALPSEYRGAYRIAPVVAAIPVSEDGRAYVVTAIDPQPPLNATAYVAAEVEQSDHGSWFADETTEPGTLAGALGDMASLAGRVYPRFL